MHNFKLQTKHFALLAFTSLMFLLMVVAFVGSQKSREFRSKAAYPPEDPCDTNPSRCQPTTPPPPNITNPPVSVRPTVTPTAQPPQVPNCSNLSGPPRLTVGQAGTYTARFYSQVANSKGRIDIADATKNPAPLVPPWGSSQNYVDSKETGVVDGNSGTGSISWTPTTTGTYFLYCRAWNDGIAECRGDAAYVDGPPRYTCAGPNSSMTVNVIGESVTTPTPTVVVPTPTPTPFAPPPITPPVGCPQKGYGDADCNGCVDGIDYSIWLNSQCHPGQTQSCADTRADFNLDGKVDDDDYKLWFDGRNIVPCIE